MAKQSNKKELSWATVDVGRACIESNANLVVVYDGKKVFWPYEGLVYIAKRTPQAITLSALCAFVHEKGEPCHNKKVGNHFTFVARSIPEQQALEEAEQDD